MVEMRKQQNVDKLFYNSSNIWDIITQLITTIALIPPPGPLPKLYHPTHY